MAQDISLLGAIYQDVPAVELPKDGGGTALFTDVTDTTITAAEAAAGTYFYSALGVKTAGSLADGNSIGYGLSDRSLGMVGVGQADYAEI